MRDNRISPSDADKTNPYEFTNPWGNLETPASREPTQPYGAPHGPANGSQAPSSGNLPPAYPPKPADPQDPAALARGVFATGPSTQADPATPFPPPAASPQIPPGALPGTPHPSGFAAAYPGQGSAPYLREGPSTPSAPPATTKKRGWIPLTAVGVAALVLGYLAGGGGQAVDLRRDVSELEAENASLADQLYDSQRRADDLETQLQNLGAKGEDSNDDAGSNGTAGSSTEVVGGNGSHLVGIDVDPGTYRTDGGTTCMWVRMSGDGSDEEIGTANAGNTQVTLLESDFMFISMGCDDWVRVD